MKEEMKTGHKEIISETLAKIKFFQNDINAYSRFLDTERIDFIIRAGKGLNVCYKEVQVKFGRIYSKRWQKREIRHTWFPLDKNKLRQADNFYYVFIAGLEGEFIFIIPSNEIVTLLNRYVRTAKNKKGQVGYHLDIDEYETGKWGIKDKSSPKSYYDITDKYLNKFDLLKSV